MKIFISMMLALLLVMGGMVGMAYAQPEEAAEVELFKFDLGISGDAFYMLSGDRAGKLLDGVSLKVIALQGDIASINLVIADMLSERSTLYGVGGSVNIPLLVEDVLHGKWLADVINPSIGLTALADFDATGRKTLGIDNLAIDIAIHLQVIQYEF